MADQAGLKQTRSTIPENTFLRDGAHTKCTCTNLTNQKNIIKIAQETAVVVPVWRLLKVSLYIDIVLVFLHLLVLWDWEQSSAQLGARRREECRICHYLAWMDSIKPRLLFSSFGCYISTGSFLTGNLETITAVVVHRVADLKSLCHYLS